jgi:hypothetical protein
MGSITLGSIKGKIKVIKNVKWLIDVKVRTTQSAAIPFIARANKRGLAYFKKQQQQ